MISRRLGARLRGALLVIPIVAALALAGCTEDPSSKAPTALGYNSGSPYREIKPADRKAVVTFSSVLDTGEKIDSSSLLGTVHVINFWYAGCGPCIAEAPLLNKVYEKYDGKIPFVGVNTYDQAATALNFEREKNVKYPSAIDVNDTNVQLAFSASVPANAVPTTLVIDKHGRVAARVTGLLGAASILEDLIDRVVAEDQ